MAVRRKKKRTHIKGQKQTDTSGGISNGASNPTPSTFVLKMGPMSRLATQLTSDFRKIMEPNTATRLQERKRNKIKDFVAMCGPLGVTHMVMFSQTEKTTNLRIAKAPQGPTLHFRILEYSLMREVVGMQRKPKSPGSEYLSAPLLVLNNMDVESSHGKLACTLFQNMFPTINTGTIKLAKVRRVALFHYDADLDQLCFRHYLINVKLSGVSKSIKRIIQSRLPDLRNFEDAADYVIRGEACLSDSEVEEDSLVTLGQTYMGAGNEKSQKRAVNLIETGPRMNLRLIKVSEGMNTGKVLYHAPGATEDGNLDDVDASLDDNNNESGNVDEETGNALKKQTPKSTSTRNIKPINQKKTDTIIKKSKKRILDKNRK